MTTRAYRTYEEAAQDYLSLFAGLRDASYASSKAVTRGSADIPADSLIEQAERIAAVSASMLPLARSYLEAPEPYLREGISGQLLAQAAAEMQVANRLIQIAAMDAASADEEGSKEAHGTTRTAQGAGLRDAIDCLEKAMAVPVSAGLMAPRMVRRAGRVAETTDEAKNALQDTATAAAGDISQRVVEVGGDLAFSLVFNTEWKTVINSVGLLSHDIAGLLDGLKEGASTLVQRAISAGARTILNAYSKILALLNRDFEDEARKQVNDWLEQIQQAGKIDLFGQLIGRLYQVNALESTLPVWLEKTRADVDKINGTTKEVAVLSDKFTVLVERISLVGDAIGLAKLVQAQFPQLLAVVTAIRVALLAVLVYAGYDYIGYEQTRYANLTKGVAEVIRDNLLPG